MSDDESNVRYIDDKFGKLKQYKSTRGGWVNWSRKLNGVVFELHKDKKTIDFLKSFKAGGIQFRLNDMSDMIECSGTLDLIPDTPQPLTDIYESIILNWLRDVGFVGKDRMLDAISHSAAMNRYHPIKEYFNGLEWDGVDRFELLMSHITFSEETNVFAQIAFKRFMIGSVAKIFEQGQNFMIVLDGVQGIGKSYFTRWICPLPKFFMEGALHPDDKDSYKRLMSYFLWEVGELEGTTRKGDRAALKDFITRQEVIIRVAFGKHDIVKPASASLIGTINEDGAGFLNDPTGSRRFAVVKIISMDHEYTDINIDQLWAQIYDLYKMGERWELELSEKQAQAAINETYESDSPVEELMRQLYNLDTDEKAFTASIDILTDIKDAGLSGNDRQNLMEISTILKREGRHKKRVKGLWGFFGVKHK